MPKPSKHSKDINMQSMDVDDSWDHMALDRATTRQHYEANEILTPEGKKHQAIVDNRDRLREMDDEPNRSGRTYRRVR